MAYRHQLGHTKSSGNRKRSGIGIPIFPAKKGFLQRIIVHVGLSNELGISDCFSSTCIYNALTLLIITGCQGWTTLDNSGIRDKLTRNCTLIHTARERVFKLRCCHVQVGACTLRLIACFVRLLTKLKIIILTYFTPRLFNHWLILAIKLILITCLNYLSVFCFVLSTVKIMHMTNRNLTILIVCICHIVLTN